LGARGWVCIGFCNWRWHGRIAGSVVVVMSKHTPGPWRAGYYDDSSGYDCMTGGISIGPNAAGPIHLDGQNYGQKRCKAIERESIERMLADARLIAAAPDLLEVLKLCQGNISSLLASKHPLVYSKWLSVVEEAIAKATGETK
jgi:hypothetical protein